MRQNKILAMPLALMFFFVLSVVLLIMTIFISSAFMSLGFSPFTTITIFFLALLGSTVNVPLYTTESTQPLQTNTPSFRFNFLYPETRTVFQKVDTTIAVNLGGAVIPVLISAYLLYTHPDIWIQFLIGIALVSAISYRFSRIIPGIGISLPLFIPPVVAALVAIALPGPDTILAFVSGVSGVLIGADILNIHRTGELQSRTMSIGGAGTFDGIFLTGIVSVLIAAI